MPPKYFSPVQCTVEPLYNGHPTGNKDFALYSEVSLAQGPLVNHAPLTIVVSYAGARLWTLKTVVLMIDLLIISPLDKNQGHTCI